MMSWQAWSPPEGWPIGAPSVRWLRLDVDEGHQVDLWLFNLDTPNADIRTLTACLNAAEQARAQRFRQALHGQRHRVTWATVRHLLAHLSQRPAASLAWQAGPHGKPALLDAAASAGHTSSLRFNLSHSGAWGLLATSFTLELGVDIEEHSSLAQLGDMVDRILSTQERSRMPPPSSIGEDADHLLRTWTRKEACLKALGTGLNRDMDTLTLDVQRARTANDHLATHGPLPTLSWADLTLPADCSAWAACAWFDRPPQ